MMVTGSPIWEMWDRERPKTMEFEPSQLVQAIERLVEQSPENRLAKIDNRPTFDAPLVAFADGDDPLFEQYKTVIGPHHMTPREALAAATPDTSPGAADRVTVVCWILPVHGETREDNKREKNRPSRSWAHQRNYGELFNETIRRHVETTLRDAGYRAVAPVLSKAFRVIRTPEEGVKRPPESTWSERHACYAAGLGTFSLNDAMITPRGIAVRCGSVVTDWVCEPTARPYPDHTANCLYLSRGTCGVCIERCPADAITTDGHDKLKCMWFVHGSDEAKRLREEYAVKIAGCGLCQTGVPCQDRIPSPADVERRRQVPASAGRDPVPQQRNLTTREHEP